MDNGTEDRVNSEELIANSSEPRHAQVYLRWVGVRDGGRFASAGVGPWGVAIKGDAVLVEEDDRVELERDREGLEKHSRASELTLELAEVGEGSVLGAWRPVAVASVVMKKRTGNTDVCRCQCMAGGECGRAVCSGAAALAKDVKAVADNTTGANWGMSMERVRALCIQTLAAGEVNSEQVIANSSGGEAAGLCSVRDVQTDCGLRVAECKSDVLGCRAVMISMDVVEGRVSRMTLGEAEAVARVWSAATGRTNVAVEKADGTLNAQRSTLNAQGEAGTETPLQRAAGLALAFCNAVDALSAEEAWKAVEVMKARLQVSLVNEQRKAVARG